MSRCWVWLLLVSSLFSLNVEKHLKTFPTPTQSQQIAPIDYIYLINLEQRPEKWRKISSDFASYGIELQRVSAIYGWHLPQSAFADLGVLFQQEMRQRAEYPVNYNGFVLRDPKSTAHPDRGEYFPLTAALLGKSIFSVSMKAGAIGCSLSHLSILQNALDAGYETIWILEDDAQIRQDPHTLQHWIEKLEMIVRREAMEKILRFVKTHGLFNPYDMEIATIPDLRLFNLKQSVVEQRHTISDTVQQHFCSIDLLSNWPLSDMEIDLETGLGCRVRPCYSEQGYSYDGTADKVIAMNLFFDPVLLHAVPKEKRVLFNWEPQRVLGEEFGRVYTCDDDLVDNQKYFKYCFPSLHPMCASLIPFEKRKLCTMIAANWLPERIKIVQFFERRAPADFAFYGQRCFPQGRRLYRGKIPGNVHFGREKIEMLQKYRFCICFENSQTNGYISEKIFGCFTAGTIPIYLGAPNISAYIPKSCFIEYRDFASDEELYLFLKQMPKQKYEEYLENIRTFLASEQAQRFSLQAFYQLMADIVF
ncbi:MAG: glycosyltransferase family 25 protein [Chlamydiia bacterium]|nr:glycosyltransferase family 25 protein [Chlamydiia bacterium]